MALLNGWTIRDTSTDDSQQTTADYRPDAGRHLTDDQYQRWINGQ